MDWNFSGGLFSLSTGWLVAYTVFTNQLFTIMGVTLYLHRSIAHRALMLHPFVSHFYRLWLWLATGMDTTEWAAVHRKHHAKVESPDDPHSPVQKGLLHIIFLGVWDYRREAKNPDTIKNHGALCPDDWVERHIYRAHPVAGLVILASVYFLVFGWQGLLVWLATVLWIPVHAVAGINGIGHWHMSGPAMVKILYQNWKDGEIIPTEFGGDGKKTFNNVRRSANISPIALWIGGEELHGNHHAFPTSAKFSKKWYEVDVGWGVILLLRALRLATIPKRS
jgi:stearoyl-CoA desaturase (Delta-9 desaturase)